MEIWSGKDITPEIWEKVRALFDAALEQEAGQREAFLARNCPDERVREQVERLLADHDKAGDFLVDPAVGCLAPSAILSHQPALSPGAILAGRFKVIRFIAEGGMGEVYEAEDLELHEHLAIKILRREVLQQTDSLARFKREVHLARKVTHPNVCRIFDLFRGKTEGNEDIVFVNMEFLRGETLAERLRRQGRLSMAEALPLITQMASALGAAHEAGIVHGDFKPGNVMLVNSSAGTRAVVTDFGLALRAIKPTTDQSLSGTSWLPPETGESRHLYGTPAYMAPEQIEGQPASTASDVYSLGLVIYEMVAGVRPFSGQTPISTAVKRLTEPPPSPRKFEPKVTPVCESVILRCLEREPAKRFPRASDVAKALSEYVVPCKDSGGVSPATPAAVSNSSPSPGLRLEVAYVLFMDIVAYSLLHMDVQQQLLNDLQDAVRNSPAFARAHTQDQLIRLPTGDGMALVFFGDPEAPLRCALDVARILHDRHDIKLRMGIHTGPVYRIADINANQNVAGGGINIAQRVMDYGDARHILVSSGAAELLSQVSAWGRMLHDLGEVEVKHGVRLHLYNLYDDEVGNLELPKKMAASARSRITPRTRKWAISALVLVIAAAVGLRVYMVRSHRTMPSNGRAPLFFAEFTNATDDPVFDDVLRDVAITELDRSPVVEVVDDDRVSELLHSMGQPPDARLNPDLAQKVCQQGKGKFLADGAIKPQGSAYTIELTVLDCESGRLVSHEQAQAKNIDEVLTTVSRLAAATRLRLSGENERAGLDPAPLPTSSVQAYKSFLAGANLVHRQSAQASALLRNATNADPDFVMAWVYLGLSDSDLGETQRVSEDYKHAFAMRSKVTGWRRQWIEALYYLLSTGEVYKAIDALRSWGNLEPKALPPHTLLGVTYMNLGLYPRAADEFRMTVALAPECVTPCILNLAGALQAEGQYDQATALLNRVKDKNAQYLHDQLYQLALLRSDAIGLEAERSWMAQHTDDPLEVGAQASIDLFAGNLSRARERTQQAVQMSLESNLKESAGGMLLTQATAEALLDESSQARKSIAAAIKLSHSKAAEAQAARVMACNGQGLEAQQIMDRLVRENSSDTLLNAVDAPLVVAASQLGRGRGDQALQSLEPIRQYEFGGRAGLLPNYLRGTAYLQLRRAKEAAGEFRSVLDHRGVSSMAPEWEMAQLGLARAYAMQGDTVKAKAAYKDFLMLWKDADPDIPVLKQAQAEYAKLK